ncbi:MAG: baseplate J/gp47 family protein [Tenacibaculum sp.]|nr:baseplate J/gp47 family protein [Tenacibaculum sp.]
MDNSYDAIRNRMKDDLTTEASKIEGSFTMDNINSVSKELARITATEVDTIPDEIMLDTATGHMLDVKALEYGMVRNKERKAKGQVKVNGSTGVIIYKDTELLSKGDVPYKTMYDVIIGASGVSFVDIECEYYGLIGNAEIGSITSFKNSITGVESVINVEKITGGTEDEEDEHFRDRIYEKIRKPISSGNKNHYVYWAKEVSGIREAKVIPLFNGNGTLKVIVLSSDYDEVSGLLLENVKEHIENNRPIGASVTVESAVSKDIRLDITLQKEENISIEVIKTDLINKINDYIKTITFDETKPLSYFKIGDLAFNAEGIVDILDYTLNGSRESIQASFNEFLKLKEVVIHVA